MKGYKASYNSICLGFKYEVGRTYKLGGKLKICENGFHFCEKMEDVLTHYFPEINFVLFEVEALGEIITKSDKSCTDEIKIVRIIPVEEHKLFEINGNTLHFKRGDIERWIDYDERGNVIHYKRSTGSEQWMRYNTMNRMIYFKDSEGFGAMDDA